VYLKADVADPRVTGESANFEQRFADRDASRGKRIRDVSPDHHLNELGPIGLFQKALTHHFAVAEHRGPVAEGEHLLEAVRDVQNRDAFAFEQCQYLAQLVHFVLSKRRRGLVQNQNAAVIEQRGGNLDQLPLCD
jgi:hypothetical protein